MRLLLAFVLGLGLLSVGGARAADVRVATLSPVENLSLPFWCDWSYDWEARCYRDDSDRLGVGGVHDSVRRVALRFPLGALPAGAVVVTAELSLWYDGTCVAPRRTTRPCDGRWLELDAHPIFTPRWLAEREVELGPVVAMAELDMSAPPGPLVWDVTDLVSDWQSGGLPNDGVLVKLAEGEESLDSSGPSFPSSTYPDVELRPRLSVWYVPP
ncbi:MAG TPA: DNRLRE domain-containing protein [Gaiellaceae bacterium]|nr:DNRLRE domain-containing protein [Gaiellaceae bacterium]